MPEYDAAVTSRAGANQSVTPRQIDRTRNFTFGSGDGLGLVIPVKTTTGDPATSDDGQLYVNTVDNVIKVSEGGVWRTIASW